MISLCANVAEVCECQNYISTPHEYEFALWCNLTEEVFETSHVLSSTSTSVVTSHGLTWEIEYLKFNSWRGDSHLYNWKSIHF